MSVTIMSYSPQQFCAPVSAACAPLVPERSEVAATGANVGAGLQDLIPSQGRAAPDDHDAVRRRSFHAVDDFLCVRGSGLPVQHCDIAARQLIEPIERE